MLEAALPYREDTPAQRFECLLLALITFNIPIKL